MRNGLILETSHIADSQYLHCRSFGLFSPWFSYRRFSTLPALHFPYVHILINLVCFKSCFFANLAKPNVIISRKLIWKLLQCIVQFL